MAKKNKVAIDAMRNRDPMIQRVRGFYTLAGVVFTVFMLFNMIVSNVVYVRSDQVNKTNTQAIQTINSIRNSFATVNINVLLITSGQSDELDKLSEDRIQEAFANIDEQKIIYQSLTADSSEALKRRFEHATYAIDNYRGSLQSVMKQMEQATGEDAGRVYQEQLAPLQEVASEMFTATVEISNRETNTQSVNAALMHGVAQDVLIVLFIFMIFALFFFGRAQVNSMLEVQQKARELTEASNRLTKSRKKLIDSAMTNILTGMKNRYALDESLTQLISNAQFNIAVFDIDNFRVINDMYGYEFGDEYLANVAERLKTDYSEHAEMFNITGNEFCMIFYEHISDLQAQQLTEQIRQSIGQPMTIAGITLQTTVSASLYHYLPSDNLDVNTLLMKMDTALHAAKHDGGNRMYQIQ